MVDRILTIINTENKTIADILVDWFFGGNEATWVGDDHSDPMIRCIHWNDKIVHIPDFAVTCVLFNTHKTIGFILSKHKRGKDLDLLALTLRNKVPFIPKSKRKLFESDQ